MERTSCWFGSPVWSRVSIVLRAALAARFQSGCWVGSCVPFCVLLWVLLFESRWSETAIAGTPMNAASIAAATVPE